MTYDFATEDSIVLVLPLAILVVLMVLSGLVGAAREESMSDINNRIWNLRAQIHEWTLTQLFASCAWCGRAKETDGSGRCVGCGADWSPMETRT